MTRYFVNPARRTHNADASPPDDFDYTSPSPYRQDRDVIVYDGYDLKAQDTGVLNQKGQRIFRAPNEIGFNR